MLTLAKIGRFFLDGRFSWEANFQRPPILLEHEKLHDGHGSTLEDEFCMRNFKGKYNSMWVASNFISLLGVGIKIGRAHV